MRPTVLICAVTGGSVALLNYFQSSKKKVKASEKSANNITSTKWDSNWDKRDPSCTVKPKRNKNKELIIDESQYVIPTAKRHLIFIRHGQYDFSGEHDNDHKLNQLGRIQAELTGTYLKKLDLNYTRIVRSTMTRAMETASIIRKHLSCEIPMESCEMIREGIPVKPEPFAHQLLVSESKILQDGARFEAAFRKYFYRADPEQKTDSYEIFVCHGNLIRYFVCRALQLPREAWRRFALWNCSITQLTIFPNGVVVVNSFGETGHLSPEEMSTKRKMYRETLKSFKP